MHSDISYEVTAKIKLILVKCCTFPVTLSLSVVLSCLFKHTPKTSFSFSLTRQITPYFYSCSCQCAQNWKESIVCLQGNEKGKQMSWREMKSTKSVSHIFRC